MGHVTTTTRKPTSGRSRWPRCCSTRAIRTCAATKPARPRNTAGFPTPRAAAPSNTQNAIADVGPARRCRRTPRTPDGSAHSDRAESLAEWEASRRKADRAPATKSCIAPVCGDVSAAAYRPFVLRRISGPSDSWSPGMWFWGSRQGFVSKRSPLCSAGRAIVRSEVCLLRSRSGSYPVVALKMSVLPKLVGQSPRGHGAGKTSCPASTDSCRQASIAGQSAVRRTSVQTPAP